MLHLVALENLRDVDRTLWDKNMDADQFLISDVFGDGSGPPGPTQRDGIKGPDTTRMVLLPTPRPRPQLVLLFRRRTSQ